ncbi:CMRF35-like molecule 8 [Triplophysa dalaica]|uniref:CMRF35-like molecule 8 n=1 Tax=Triplophysa dalaica TaxID=1582913 RepID=UPI0024E00AC3|nr:CMRF35-like molecule 8 [Triplophysa dalaica]
MFGKLSIVVILLTVLGGTFCELNLRTYKGQTAKIECAYTAENIFNAKYFFKVSAGPNIKSIYSLKGRRVLRDGRVSMSDDFQRKIISISIFELTESDSGHYACAIGKGHSLETFAVVRLSVMTAPQIVNIEKPSIPTVRPFLSPFSETSKSVNAVTEMSKEQEVLTVFSDWWRTPLYVLSFLIVVLLSCGLILLLYQTLWKRSSQNKRHKKTASKGNDNSKNYQKTEKEYNELDVCRKFPDSIYHNLNKKQCDLI